MFNRVVLLLFVLPFAACRTTPKEQVPGPPVVSSAPAMEEVTPPKRLILFIGDGMGVGQLTAATYAKGAPLEMLQMPYLGFMTTHEYEFLTTDSAASATAISTGRKASYEAVSVTPGTPESAETDPGRHMQTLLELASQHGLRTGMVTTSRVNHATPAAFGAHRFHRSQYEEIASDIAASELDVLFGPGSKYFNDRKDDRDLLKEMGARGWATATTVEELDALPADASKVAALLHPQDYPFIIAAEPRAMPLEEMVGRAIEALDRGEPSGWVLMVEGSFVDWCGHTLDGACAAVETLDLDAAVARARNYAKGRKDTLIVATADHETAGMAVIDPYYSARFAKILGGEEAAAKMVASPDGKPSPPPFQHIKVGASSAKFEGLPLPGPGPLGMDELVDARASIVVGHFSMASRPFWKSAGRFYGAHSPVMVSIHAEGPGAQTVAATRDNADLGRALRDLVVAGATGEKRTKPAAVAGRPKNVILMVGDGMGLPSITGAHYWGGALRMLEMPSAGLVSTHAVDYLVNDSAASATAMATGRRTRKKTIGMVIEDGEKVSAASALEVAERNGLATGLVTTTPITHATPAAFLAHQVDRYQTEGIVADIIGIGDRAGLPEILIGGGAGDFDAAAREKATAAGYTVTTSWPPAANAQHVLALLADEELPEALQRQQGMSAVPTLATLTTAALDFVSADEDGFFLMVEGGQIDWRLHQGRQDSSIFAETIDFDDAVRVAADFASERGDTLVIVTADHDHTMSLLDNHYAFESGRCGVSTRCGGPLAMTMLDVDPKGVPHTEGFADKALQGEYAPPQLLVQYAWPVQEAMNRADVRASHSANFVPIFASGPWATRFDGFIDQPEIGLVLHEWLEAPAGK